MEQKDVVIIGGGPAGLAAAVELHKPAKVCQEVKAENLNKNNCCRVQ